MKKNILQLLILPFLFVACKMQDPKNTENNFSESFLPMQIGNYWKMDAQNYTEIQDTIRIDGKLYYKFYSLIGGDAVSTVYLRIDENNQLKESWPEAAGREYTRANFNSKVGDSFFTLNDQSTNDYKVTVIEKTDKKMTFSFDMIYQENMKGYPHKVTYIRGQGLDDGWKSIKIDGKVVK
ncbi:hypothetical protein M2347_002090 [Chryseobacterium sp. H1D6B]|uniref:hypothetical protein n=1 Tax=Chryseobacterium sp. H1D6B TaxID=2940588 RepID=UPI0015C98F58|nr:hypothetical protein [Chryseobacterium sp. H1D6B]MDH6252363.1 hypothetical protein [Chryseobacterium sp. H1D6B]